MNQPDLFDTGDAFNLASEVQRAPDNSARTADLSRDMFAVSETLSFAPTKLDQFNTAKK